MAKEMTIAWKWVNRLDEDVVEKMQDDAVAVADESTEQPVYIFADGSAVYEKRRGDWYPAGEYVQCQLCDEWRKAEEFDALDDKCATCIQDDEDNEVATALLKSKVW